LPTWTFGQVGKAGRINQTRLIQRGGKLFAYGADNRLASVTKQADGSLLGAYVYNGRGERVKRTVYPAANPAKTTLYVYDLSGNLIGDYDDQGNLNSEYVYGPTGRLATLKPWYGNTKWQMNDHLGTPQALTDVNGTVVWTMSQTPFGRATVNMDPDGDGKNVYNNFRFPGQYWDWETQTNYNYYRSYDPAIGRYTQSDPIGLDGGTNTYEYVKGDPAARVDMLGLYQCTYSISHHRMICLADNTPHPNFESSRYVSGNNSLPRPVSGNYQNNPTMTNVPFFGPIPMGNYIIGQQLIPSSRRALIPSPFNNMYGRFAFQTHGCANPNTCSEGCIAATTNITRNRFNDLMQLEEGHNTLSVVP
jgi:RHS repeat-associated protein